MESAYTFLRTDSVEKQDELTLWMYLHIRGVPNNVFRFEQYCRDLVGKFRALPETHYPLAFVLWCKTMCTRITADDGQVTANYDILTSILIFYIYSRATSFTRTRTFHRLWAHI
jgi:hypothetical protein